jgi:ubiquinone/menaquinone biosynthesis C-methylase UbiE
VSERVDFSANAPIYDRRHGDVLAPEIARSIAGEASLAPGARVLDIGAGTGRVSLALADLGCDVVALDPALPMLYELRRKAAGPRLARAAVGEGARLPFTASMFDAVVIARLLYLVTDWRAVLDAARDVLAPGGCVLHEWANGETDEPWVRIREKARGLFQDAGIEVPFHPGARTEGEVDAYILGLGFTRSGCVSGGAGPETTLREFLHRLVTAELSYIWNVPIHVQQACLPHLQQWSEDTFDLDRAFPAPKELWWRIYRL